jgi:hypothetical protein
MKLGLQKSSETVPACSASSVKATLLLRAGCTSAVSTSQSSTEVKQAVPHPQQPTALRHLTQ